MQKRISYHWNLVLEQSIISDTSFVLALPIFPVNTSRVIQNHVGYLLASSCCQNFLAGFRYLLYKEILIILDQLKLFCWLFGEQWVYRWFRCYIYLGVNHPIPRCQYCLERANDWQRCLTLYANNLIFVGENLTVFRVFFSKLRKCASSQTFFWVPVSDCHKTSWSLVRTLINDGFSLIPRLFTSSNLATLYSAVSESFSLLAWGSSSMRLTPASFCFLKHLA